jgi:hypothetical protein
MKKRHKIIKAPTQAAHDHCHVPLSSALRTAFVLSIIQYSLKADFSKNLKSNDLQNFPFFPQFPRIPSIPKSTLHPVLS